jgi:hypothetical protein
MMGVIEVSDARQKGHMTSSTSTSGDVVGGKKNPFSKGGKAKSTSNGDADDADDTKRSGHTNVAAATSKSGKGNRKKGRGGEGDDDRGSAGSAQRSGAVSTNEAKRPPKWKVISCQTTKKDVDIND